MIVNLRAKCVSRDGFTLVELLASAAVAVLVALIISTGMKVATETQRITTAASEIEVLESSLINVVTEELRSSRNLKFESPTDPHLLTSFDSMNYGKNARFLIPETGESQGQLCVETGSSTLHKMLPAAAYGDASGNTSSYAGAFKVTVFKVTYDKTNGIFHAIMKLQDKGEGTKGAATQTEFDVKRLNASTQQDALAP